MTDFSKKQTITDKERGYINYHNITLQINNRIDKELKKIKEPIVDSDAYEISSALYNISCGGRYGSPMVIAFTIDGYVEPAWMSSDIIWDTIVTNGGYGKIYNVDFTKYCLWLKQKHKPYDHTEMFDNYEYFEMCAKLLLLNPFVESVRMYDHAIWACIQSNHVSYVGTTSSMYIDDVRCQMDDPDDILILAGEM